MTMTFTKWSSHLEAFALSTQGLHDKMSQFQLCMSKYRFAFHTVIAIIIPIDMLLDTQSSNRRFAFANMCAYNITPLLKVMIKCLSLDVFISKSAQLNYCIVHLLFWTFLKISYDL